jgi:hypothetical protein
MRKYHCHDTGHPPDIPFASRNIYRGAIVFSDPGVICCVNKGLAAHLDISTSFYAKCSDPVTGLPAGRVRPERIFSPRTP